MTKPSVLLTHNGIYRMPTAKRRRVQLLLMSVVFLLGMILIGRALVGYHPAGMPDTGLQDKAQALVTGEHEPLQADIQRINHQLKATTVVWISHPLQTYPPMPLTGRGIWLAYDPSTQQTSLKLGEKLQTPPHHLLLLGSSLQPVLESQLKRIALHPVTTGQKLHLMLNQVVQPYGAQASASLVSVPGGG